MRYCFTRIIGELIVIYLNIIGIKSHNVIDVDDILSEDYMPGTLLVLENPKGNFEHLNATVGLQSQFDDGSFDTAMNTMDYHRHKMNEYLCRNYIAEQIINDMTLIRIKRRMGTEAIGTNAQLSTKNELLHDEGSSNYKNWLSKSTTLEDIYRHYERPNIRVDANGDDDADKDDEVEEEYDGHISGYELKQKKSPSPSKLDHSGGGGSGGAFYPGGYPYSLQGAGQHGYPYNHAGYSGYGHSGVSSHGTGAGMGTAYQPTDAQIKFVGHFAAHPIHEEEHIVHDVPKYHLYHEDHHAGNNKEHDLADLFEIALTALAFLSFGMFIIHVIMCISMTNNNATSTAAPMMMPMSMNPTGTGMGMSMDGGGMTMGDGGTDGGMTGMGEPDADGGANTGETDGAGESEMGGGGDGDNAGDTGGGSPGTGDGASAGTGDAATAAGDDSEVVSATGLGPDGQRDTLKFRLKRDMPTITNPDNWALNELARRILTSIEAALIANEDDGNCLRNTLCENNKYSRSLTDKNKILLPLWSLGMSWVVGRLANNVTPSTSMLDSLKASILGLGKANCEIIYQNCDLKYQRKERQKGRKKRNVR